MINQISHSKKWESKTPELDELGNPVFRTNGNPKFIKSYSILQDELFEHMQEAGFRDFERGERGSQHLSSLQYQYQKDLERKAELEKMIELETLQYEPAHNAFEMYQKLDLISRKRSFTGKIVMEENNFNGLLALAKEAITGRGKIQRLENETEKLRSDNYRLRQRVERLTDKVSELTELCKPYLETVKRFPEKVKGFLDDLMKIPEKEKQLKLEAPSVKSKKQKRDERSR